ncbi:MAG: hypothetical protein MRT15_12440 [archaeon YNP-LCB-003-016]|uniref:hypothetical protein n=1 Tax=Candidatus Culexarchaeum yellowstonense TaxID=2928963 RepID=UPI0026F12024|nr:hypothetical protein [Candidatus Culexarchaeum yellowstonense]MCR6693196.1 hypothetical protein [Candidatus Culexarchaeum yellowstonense]
MSYERVLHLAEVLLVIASFAMLMGSIFLPIPFKIFGYEFTPPHLRIPPEIGLVVGLILLLVIPVISCQMNRFLRKLEI